MPALASLRETMVKHLFGPEFLFAQSLSRASSSRDAWTTRALPISGGAVDVWHLTCLYYTPAPLSPSARPINTFSLLIGREE